MSLLNLPSLKFINLIEIKESDLRIKVECKAPPSACHYCGCIANLQKFGKKRQLFLDIPMQGKRVGLLIDRQRYRCKECKTTFLEVLEDMDDKRLATKRLIDYIEKKALEQTNTSLAEEVGMDEKSIRNIFRGYVNHLEEIVKRETPNYLGIHEINYLKKPRSIFTNVEHNTIIDLLANRNKTTIINYLYNLPNLDKIQYVVMDMWKPYKDAVNEVLPQAKILVNKFHGVRMVDDAIEKVRKDLRTTLTQKEKRLLTNDRYVLRKRHKDLSERELFLLDMWKTNYPILKAAYDLKEGFYDFWDSDSPEKAFEKFEEWKSNITEQVQFAFEPIVNAVHTWKVEIFNYFEHPITNTYTESLNRLISLINLLDRGYSFTAFRTKILFAEGMLETKQPNSGEKVISETRSGNISGVVDKIAQCHSFERYKDKKETLGTDISALIKFVEEGL